MTAQRTRPARLALPLADTLLAEAQAIAIHWLDRLNAMLPSRVTTLESDLSVEPQALALERAGRVVEGIAQSLAASAAVGSGEPRPLGGGWDVLTLAAWEYGVSMQAAGRPLLEVPQDFDLLLAVLLHECEKAAGQLALAMSAAGAEHAASLGEAFQVSRRLHEVVSQAAIAATAGHAQEGATAARSRLRSLRHDLRNPIATIQNVASLMQDEAMPAEARNDPRYAGMLYRNTTTLGDLVTRELSDGMAIAPDRIDGPVFLGSVALSVRRSLRAELDVHGVRLEIADDLPVVSADSTMLALALRAVVAAAVRVAPSGGTLYLSGEALAHEPGSRAPRVRLTLTGIPALAAEAFEQLPSGQIPLADCADAAAVAARAGGRVRREPDAVVLEMA
ncbi:MAG TPA: hypothetical protein VKZ41_03505 [Gemmatimonadales bacterium]|nr:hypothetical protein [Gemmatimonadales bacterium]